ncbi:sugar dehydrogenase complex small subunit [Streptomyces sp. TLI_105]|uniref:sugar dehydrogenase complex small subunit n=1 Tax=Streptomyces sp. TLI_105 TaxID=1881019 RepID=UPI0008983EDE|nr:sugar dehydrogenase complex small subunit [Streptomyces sp. TLI_105]SEE09396.1 Membrane bound FAD containing D-sorbitol dehydrogenase [Streptomyces sp. TLI_105]
MTHAADFPALSELLTGESSLDQALADAYRERLHRAYPADLDRLIDAWRTAATQPDPGQALAAALDADTALARVAKETIMVWFTAQFKRPDETQDPPGTPEQYRAGLVWQVIRAHPLSAAPTGGYGYWAYQP